MKYMKRSSYSSRNSRCSSLKKKEIKVQTSAPILLEYIQNRILDHIKMKKFLEPQEVTQFLNQINKLITSQDEVEALRKRIKNMLLTINDSIIEFEQAVSFGEITFESFQNETSNYANVKPSESTSGVSTLDENACLSSLDLTNSNFLTVPTKHSEIEATQSQFLQYGNTAVITQDLSLSSSANESFLIPSNRNSGSKNSIIEPLKTEKLVQASRKNTPIQSFHQLTNLMKPAENCDTQRNILTSDENKMIEICNFSQDLFIEPLPYNSRKETSKPIPPLKTTKRYSLDSSHGKTEQINSIDSNFDNAFMNNLKQLSLEDKIFNIDKLNDLRYSPQKTKLEDGKLQLNDLKLNIKLDNPFNKIQYLDNSDSSESEIFFPAGLNALKKKGKEVEFAENKKKVNLMNEQSSEFDVEIVRNESEKTQINKKIERLPAQHCSLQSQKQNGNNMRILESGCCIPDTFSEMIQPETYHSQPSQGVKRKFLDQSTNLSMINGEIVSPTINNGFINSEKISSENHIWQIKDSHDLDNELKEATLESSIIWNHLKDLLVGEKQNLIITRECSIEYSNLKLKFPTGYEHHYKHLEDLLLEYKSIGISNNVYQMENQHCFFEDTMSKWTELQEIVKNIQKQEKVKEK